MGTRIELAAQLPTARLAEQQRLLIGVAGLLDGVYQALDALPAAVLEFMEVRETGAAETREQHWRFQAWVPTEAARLAFRASVDAFAASRGLVDSAVVETANVALPGAEIRTVGPPYFDAV